MTTIHSKRCLVRPFKESDLDDFIAYRNNADWMRYQGFKGLTKEAYVKALLVAPSLEQGAQLAIACKKTDRLLGDIFLKKQGDSYWLGYTIAPEKARQGYAYEVVSAIITRLKNSGAKQIMVATAPQNKASIALLKKLNFVFLKTDEDESIFVLPLNQCK